MKLRAKPGATAARLPTSTMRARGNERPSRAGELPPRARRDTARERAARTRPACSPPPPATSQPRRAAEQVGESCDIRAVHLAEALGNEALELWARVSKQDRHGARILKDAAQLPINQGLRTAASVITCNCMTHSGTEPNHKCRLGNSWTLLPKKGPDPFR